MNIRIIILFVLIVLAPDVQGQEVTVIVNDEFADNPFKTPISQVTVQRMLSGDVRTTKKTLLNANTQKLDTLITYKSACCTFSFLKTEDQILFYDATIITPELTLSKGVAVGLSKKNFIKMFSIPANKTSGKVFIIDNTTGLCNHSFYFEDDKLATIVIDGCLD